MSAKTEADLAAFADQTGIHPASGDKLERLNVIQHEALELIRLAELEKSGICGGDGTWRASDPLEGVADGIGNLVATRDEPTNGAG